MNVNYARATVLLLLYAIVLVWLTWPLASRPGTLVPNTKLAAQSDGGHALWALAWETHALTTDPARLPDANIYHPAESALFYGPTAFGALPFFGPVFLASGNPVLAMNAVFLGGLTLTAWVLHLVAARWTGSFLGGFLAAWTLLTTRWTLWHWIPMVPYWALLFPFPLVMFLTSRPAMRGRPMLLLLLPLLVLQCLIDPVYLASALILPLSLLGLWRLLCPSTRRNGLLLLTTIGFAVLCLAPVYAGYARVQTENPSLPNQTVWNREDLTRLPGAFLAPRAPTAVPAATLVLVGLGAGILAVRTRRTETRDTSAWRHGAFWACAGVVLSLEPPVFWGETRLPLPHDLVAQAYEVLRAPQRLGVATLLGLSVLAAAAFSQCEQRIRSSTLPRSLRSVAPLVLAALVAGSMYSEYLRGGPAWSLGSSAAPPSTYPVMERTADPPELTEALRRSTAPLLELPIDPRHHHGRSALLQSRAMVRSISHWRPLLNGYSSFWPDGFPERMELTTRLPAPNALATLRRETGVAHILVRRGPGVSAWEMLAEHGGRSDIRLVLRTPNELLFTVDDPAPPPGVKLEFRSPTTEETAPPVH
ncbi:hypothetical protein MK489_23395 [Myxococcota bacterium]|nr:hypothetical protein [Myxococcota bacterium]